MADTARKTDKEKEELFDSEEVLNEKVDLLVRWLRESKHPIAFTGAGISTSAGIPDFRSGMGTCLSTGPGAWELRAHNQLRAVKHKTVSTLKAIPTTTHMMFVTLQKHGHLKCIVSQNTDGLHRRSGFPVDALYELHGNSNLEVCIKCGRQYLRDFHTRVGGSVHNHLTGRLCDDPKCTGKLKDTIINFGENLPERTLQRSIEHGKQADLCLAMGSSLTVTPAADIPEDVGRNGRLVIVNLQRTPLDDVAALRINGKCDDVAVLVMKKLGLEVEPFSLKRGIHISVSPGATKTTISLQGIDKDGRPFSFVRRVVYAIPASKARFPVDKEPLELVINWVAGQRSITIHAEVQFNAHYGEPNLEVDIHIVKGKAASRTYQLEYDPFAGAWLGVQENLLEAIGEPSAKATAAPKVGSAAVATSGSTKAKASASGGTKPKTSTSKPGAPKGGEGGFVAAMTTMNDLVDEMKSLET